MAKGESSKPISLKSKGGNRGSRKRRKVTERIDKKKQRKINNSQRNKANPEKEREKDYFGDKITIKNDDTLRISFININGIPATKEDYKNMRIYEAIEENQIEIMGMSEVNRCWHIVGEEHRWRERTFGWWESSNTTIGYNTTDSVLSNYQPGVTMQISINKPAHRIIETGRDETGLGRWVWQKYRGKQDITLRVITAYRPCTSSNAGPSTTHSQQERYFDLKGDDRTPRKAILDDLKIEIEKWKEEGDQIILLMDVNEDINTGSVKMWLHELQLREAITTKHRGNEETYNRGSKAIDGIFISASINH